jgi:hypothetical protein
MALSFSITLALRMPQPVRKTAPRNETGKRMLAPVRLAGVFQNLLLCAVRNGEDHALHRILHVGCWLMPP